MTEMSPRLVRILTVVLLGLVLAIATALPSLALQGDATPARAATAGAAQDGATRTVEILPVHGYVDPPVARTIVDVIARANAEGSVLVVVQLSSEGAVSADLDAALGAIAASEVPVAVFVGPRGVDARAGGAAGLLLGGAHVRAAAEDATVGPLSPSDLGEPPGVYPEAERAAELFSAVEPSLVERLLATAVDAPTLEDADAVDLVVPGLEPLLVELDGRTVTTAAGEVTLQLRSEDLAVRFHSLGFVRRMLHAATTAPFVYLLIVAGLGMLLFELFQPGFGVAGIAGLVTTAIGAFGLTVLPVAWWALVLLVLGLVLFAVDTAIAGFGAVTLAATASFVAGSSFLYDSPAIGLSGWLVGATATTTFVFFVFVMTSILRAQAGPEGVELDQLVGRPGIVRSVLNPEGHVYIDGALWRARWQGDRARAKVGTPVRVTGVEGPMLVVEAFDPDAAGAPPVSGAAVADRPAS